MKKTKIIATLGPSSDDPKIMGKLIDAGVNIFRINFSHATEEERVKRVKDLRTIEKTSGKPVTILQDLQGPKIRVGKIDGSIELTEGKEITLTIDTPAHGEVPVQYQGIVSDVESGNRILLVDGKIVLEVISKDKKRLNAKSKLAVF